MHEVNHISIYIDRSPRDVYRVTSDPRNLPRWAAGLVGAGIKQEGDTWIVEAPFGRASVKFAEQNDFGVMDHEVVLESGVRVYNPMRVVPNGDGSEFLFTVIRQPGMSDDQFQQDSEAVAADLKTLKALLECESSGFS